MYNLLKMERYQLLRNKIYWVGVLAVFLVGFLTADTYEAQWGGPDGGAATALIDIFNGMIYDFTLPMVILCGLLALLLGQEFTWRTVNQEICAGHARIQIFASKIIAYLLAFNLLAILYPVAGCIREYAVFGLEHPGAFWIDAIKGTFYSFLLNGSCFMMAVFCCYYFKNSAVGMAFSVGLMFLHGLCYAYGMFWNVSAVVLLPAYQIRAAVTSKALFQPMSLAIAVVWLAALTAASWQVFRKRDLK